MANCYNLEEFKKELSKLKFRDNIKFDPLPQENDFEKLEKAQEGDELIPIHLLDGTLSHFPLDQTRKRIILANAYIVLQNNGYTWDNFVSYLGLEATDDEDEVRRILPDGEDIYYGKRYEEDILYLNSFIKFYLNGTKPFVYPPNWWSVIKKIYTFHGNGIGCSGDVMVMYYLANPRKVYERFVVAALTGQTDESLAVELFNEDC